MVKKEIRDGAATGTFACPDSGGPFPAVLALGGSDGGTPDYFLNLLVPEGFAVFALIYWGTPETQFNMAEIPVERVEQGLRWLSSQPDVQQRGSRVGIIGASRGGELALLAASTFPDLVGPVVAYTPSNVVWMGLDFAHPSRVCSSWSRKGGSVPYVPFPQNVAPAQTPEGLSMLPMFEAGLQDRTAVEQGGIPVERATGPLMLVSGGDDRVWPAGRMCQMMVERMTAHGRAGDVVHHHYPAAGHMLFPYSLPADGSSPPFALALGGTADANADAHASVWPNVVAHLRGLP
jgi:dienelactone hydrolase